VVQDTELLVINWRLPIAAPFYEASVNDSRGLARRRRFDLDDLRLRSIIDETFSGSAKAAADRPSATRTMAPHSSSGGWTSCSAMATGSSSWTSRPTT